MKKLFVSTILGLSFSSLSIAETSSLDSLLNKQDIVTIAPVTFKSAHVISNAGSGAAYVCASLGYTRVIEHQEGPCDPGESLAGIYGGNNNGAFRFYTLGDECKSGRDGYRIEKLLSITCAR